MHEKDEFVISPVIVKNSHCLDRLVYGTQRGELIIRKMPYLERLERKQIHSNSSIVSILVSPDRRFLLVGCVDLVDRRYLCFCV